MIKCHLNPVSVYIFIKVKYISLNAHFISITYCRLSTKISNTIIPDTIY